MHEKVEMGTWKVEGRRRRNDGMWTVLAGHANNGAVWLLC